ncbi:TPA: cobalamin biosynthesis protein CbiX, partial [Citrobacter freundii]|nr:cobalamin biosynthesis protein CbiX [Citrobacter freundii]HCB1520020.1 cobalamin biosynthesis protein CbiX [Citrobacter freundii]
TTVLGLAASTGVFSYADNMPLALLYGSASVVSFLYALDCFLPLYLSRKSH